MSATMTASRALRLSSVSRSGVRVGRLNSTTQKRHQSSKRRLHQTSQNDHAVPFSPTPAESLAPSSITTSTSSPPPLACLSLAEVLRSYLITTMSSSPTLLGASTKMLRAMLESKNPLFQLEKNPLMRAILWETFYKQFCAGENKTQISQRCHELRQQGYSGVILEYALEVSKDSHASDESADVETWRNGMLKTVEMAAPGDFIGLKWSGLGPAALKRMAREEEPSNEMSSAMHALARAAAAKDIALLPAAEESWNLAGFHHWSLAMQREYNTRGKAVVYTTYQMYLKQAPATLARHLAMARADGFTLGAKLVRGAYLATETRSLIHDTIEHTHHAYDTAAAALIAREYNETVRPTTTTTMMPAMNVMLASHNATTVERATAARRAQRARGEALTPLVFAQLQGMADEVSCALVAAGRAAERDPALVREKVFKNTTWGTMGECLNYLLRRAAENKDAAGRTGETRRAMGRELVRRLKGGVWLA